jgi:Helix-hairpin-helix motif
MGSNSRWIIIGCLAFILLGGPFRVVAWLHNAGLFPRATIEQVVTELKREPNVQTAICQSGQPAYEFICEVDVQVAGDTLERRRFGINSSSNKAVGLAVPLPLDGRVLNESQGRAWWQEEQRKRDEPVNIRTATVAELLRIPRVDQYRAQEIHAAVRFGLVRKFDDLLKIQGIDQQTLAAMRTRAYWK